MKLQIGGDHMSELFDDLCEGLQQAIDFEKGKGKEIGRAHV